MTSDESIFGEEAVVRWLVLCEVSAEWEKLLKVFPDYFQAGKSTRRAWLECCVIATKRRVEIVNGDGEWCGPVTGAALRDVRDGGLCHESLVVIPERLQIQFYFGQQRA